MIVSLRSIQHKNLIVFLGIHYEKGIPSIVMPRMNCNLYELPMEEKWELKAMLNDISSGLYHLHMNQLAHGDLHLKNVLVNDREGSLVLADWGLSRIVHSTKNSRSTPAQVSTYKDFMPPEINSAADDLDSIDVDVEWDGDLVPEAALRPTYNTDIYSFGIIIGTIARTAQGRKVRMSQKEAVKWAKDSRSRPNTPPVTSFSQVRLDARGNLGQLLVDMVASDPARRPNIGGVIARLNELGL
ncbi:kinase-like protein [Clavulina sp. PMI_390]|nr:kinase-like protein [Clavulina sp. PMI_390]